MTVKRRIETPCEKCGVPMGRHVMDFNKRTLKCPIPVNAALPDVPSSFRSKAIPFDLFSQCKKCHVKKYINRDSKCCFACTGLP